MIRTNLVMNTMCSLQSEWHALFRFFFISKRYALKRQNATKYTGSIQGG